MKATRTSSLPFAAVTLVLAGCSATEDPSRFDDDGSGTSGAGASSGVGSGSGGGDGGFSPSSGSGAGPDCGPPCSADGTQVLACDGTIVKTCTDGLVCGGGTCLPPCEAAEANKSSVGCEYHAVMMAGYGPAKDGCFVTFVANAHEEPVHVTASFAGAALDLGQFARIPKGSGAALEYLPYDPVAGLPPGEVAILFLANKPNGGTGLSDPVACPVPAAISIPATDGGIANGPQVINTGRSHAFRIETDRPVVAYQMLPYGGGSAAVTGATLLLPTSAWDTNYITVEAYEKTWAFMFPPSMNIVAAEDDTQVTILPKVEIKGWGNYVLGTPANVPVTWTLSAGEVLQITEEELTGSPIQSNKPIGLFGGHYCMNVPYDRDYCDHAEQQIPPVRALGSEYAAVGHPDRSASVVEKKIYRVVGAVDGTQLTYDPPVGGPPSIGLGSVFEIETDQPFVVKSQDADHPFLVATYMTGSSVLETVQGYGDPEFVRVVPSAQWLSRYVFFTDPTYPETHLVVVRKKGDDGFADVTLDCGGTVGGWMALGSEYQYAYLPLVRHDFEPQNGCDNGRREMSSSRPFGLTVWGWGTTETVLFTRDVSYAYPAGENVAPINDVVVLPEPK